MLKKLAAAIFSAAFAWGASAEPIEVGKDAPKVTGKNEEGKEMKLEDLYKKGPVFIFFYPKAQTPG